MDTNKTDLILKSLGYKRIHKSGDGMMLFVPTLWVKANGYEVNERYYVKIIYAENGTLILKPANKEDINATLEANKNA